MNLEWPTVLSAYRWNVIAHRVRVSKGTVNNWKHGHHFPTSHRVIRDLAAFLGVTQPAIKVAIRMYRNKLAA